MKKTVLVVDDDEDLVELLKKYLEKDGYDVLTAYDGNAALNLFRLREVDLIVLDLMLPKVDGLNVCRTVRSESQVPIIMLTAKTEEEDRIKGLDLGADDYVTKPFSPGELLARIRAVLRRTSEEEQKEVSHGNLHLNFETRQVLINNEPVDLTPTEFKILATMVKQPRRVFSRPDLIHSALGYGYEGFERTIDVHIKNIRKKLEPDPDEPTYIRTVHGVGYKFDPATEPDGQSEQDVQ
ncbi:response regulator transcription factor [Candidatus Bipolaricaulota bacterium]|nr:response regulator transcription factor [Candidatus Bipolaricaulota bacterium]